MSKRAIGLLTVCMAALLAASAASEPKQWVLTGLEWSLSTPAPVPESVVNHERIKEQIEAGCLVGRVHFADTAAMRDTAIMRQELGPVSWASEVRDLVASSAFVDDKDDALEAIDDALAAPDLDSTQIAILRNQRILVALQFGDRERAASMLDRYGLPDEIPRPLLSDRLFWSVLLQAENATGQAWRDTLEPMLQRAFEADSASFQVRVWRLIAWLEGRAGQPAGCSEKIRSFSDVVLDVSEASACPMMIGHLAYALDRHFRSRARGDDRGQRGVWRVFAEGLFAVVSGERDTAEEAINFLAGPAAGTTCAVELGQELSRALVEVQR